MFCKNCGTPMRKNERFCRNCGAIADKNEESKTGTPYKSFLHLMVKYNSILIILLEIVTFIAGLIYIEMDHKKPILLYILILSGIFFTSVCLYYAVKNKSHETYLCPKCGETTHHNRYHVCDKCHMDIGSNMIFSLLCFLASFCMLMFGYQIVYSIIHAYYYNQICGPAIALIMGFAIITPIYMYPAKLARRTEHTAARGIFWLNIFFGATFIMWIVLMIWASSGKGTQKTVVVQQSIAPQKSVNDSFDELKKLKDMGMISEEEFEEKRKEIIQRI